jgi:hypothetical protein
VTSAQAAGSTFTANSVSVLLPADGFSHLARLVTAGFVAQVPLGFEGIDDIQLAIELILRSLPVDGTHARVHLTSDEQGITVALRSFEPGTLDAHLQATVHDGLDLRTYLGRLVDSIEVIDGGSTVVLRKRYASDVPA